MVKSCHADGAWTAHVAIVDVSFVIVLHREHGMGFAPACLARPRAIEFLQEDLVMAALLVVRSALLSPRPRLTPVGWTQLVVQFQCLGRCRPLLCRQMPRSERVQSLVPRRLGVPTLRRECRLRGLRKVPVYAQDDGALDEEHSCSTLPQAWVGVVIHVLAWQA